MAEVRIAVFDSKRLDDYSRLKCRMPKWLSVCVCVCGTLSPRVRSLVQNCRAGPLKSPLSTRLLLSWEDIQADHLDVLAVFFHCMARG